MNNIAQFVPRAELDARANLAEFIRLARQDLTAFDDDGAWDGDRWQQGKAVAVFATKTAELTPYRYTPLADPFRQFAKAYVRYQFSHRPVVSVAIWMQGLRCIEAALLQATGGADVTRLNGVVMDVSAQKCREFYPNPEVCHKTGLVLKTVFDFCRSMRFAPALPQWESPFRKPTILTEDLGEAGKAHREGKLPSNGTMLMLADLFAGAEDPEALYFTSILILLMATPSRISEVLTLPVDCIHWEDDDNGTPQMYLRWTAAKGKGAMKKWVVPAMHSVVQEAVRRLVAIGQAARCAAKHAYDVSESSGGAQARATFGGDVSSGSGVSEALAAYGGPYWPFIDARKTVRAWDALCLHREREFHRDFEATPFSWRLPGTTEVNDRTHIGKGMSLFERHGMRNADGTPVKLTTHQPRHWLSTMCERAGMDDHTLAQWAGRADPKHNRHYDHRTPEERMSAARDLLPHSKPSLLQRIQHREPVDYQELGVDRLGTAKATLYGMCTHDYAMAPCQKQRECMTCTEHVCVKGDHVTLERLQRLEEQTAGLLHKAQQAQEEGLFGADRWVDNHKWKLAHVRAMRLAMENPAVPDGAVLRIPDGHDPSPVQRTLMGLGCIEAPRSEAASVALTALLPIAEAGGANA